MHATAQTAEEVLVSPYAVVGEAGGRRRSAGTEQEGAARDGGAGAVGGGVGGGEPIYNANTISGLASGVELTGSLPATEV